MTRCDDFYKKWQKDGNFCGIDNDLEILINTIIKLYQIDDIELTGQKLNDVLLEYTDTFTERNIQYNIVFDDLKIVGYEMNTEFGRIDIVVQDENNNLIPVEVKKGCAGDCALGQILRYKEALKSSCAIIVAGDFTDNLIKISHLYNIHLVNYTYLCLYKDVVNIELLQKWISEM